MTSKEQSEEIVKKIVLVVLYFLETKASIKEISESLGISASSVQRYLSDKRIIKIFDQETYEGIKLMLSLNQQLGRHSGGVTSSLNNIPVKDASGKYIGNEPIAKKR
ncbi:MAG: helix-turn-helix domain containing protein [Bacilli bacterium]|nr:helix-turn-helix domain containing protein [Bacilli bacterium]